MKQHWNTQVIADLIAKNFPEYEILLEKPNVGYNTSTVFVTRASSEHREYLAAIFGMGEKEIPFEAADDVDVYRIHCTASARYGMDESVPAQMRMVADLTEMLLGAGYAVSSDGWEGYY